MMNHTYVPPREPGPWQVAVSKVSARFHPYTLMLLFVDDPPKRDNCPALACQKHPFPAA